MSSTESHPNFGKDTPAWARTRASRGDAAHEALTPAGRDFARLAESAVAGETLKDHGVSLYVHFPYCVSKCRYCDFNSYAWSDQDLSRHADFVLREAEQRATNLKPQTVFFGGGTPSLLPAEELRRFLEALHESIGFRDHASEVTMEANPESLDAETAQAALEGGVNRISIGVQSLRAEVLEAYDRVHTGRQAQAAYRAAREAGIPRINVDLIYAFPGQDPKAWEEDLRTVLEWQPDHLSAYELSYEPGTALTRLKEAGRWTAEDPERARALFDRTREICADAGYGQYEISNYARAGEACRHNLAYWRLLDYVGLGAGAHEWRAGIRRKNLDRPEEYEARIQSGQDPAEDRQCVSPRTSLFDTFMMGLRLLGEGVDLGRAMRVSGMDPWQLWQEPLTRLHEEGWLESISTQAGGTAIRLTEQGRPFLDSVLVRLLPDEDATMTV